MSGAAISRHDELTLKLYYAPNTCSLASHIVLEEVGAAYEAVRIDFAIEEQRKPPYLATNPQGRVPALATNRGILTETPAILAFLAQSFPDSGLVPPNDAFAFARIQAFNSYLCSTAHVAHAHRMRGYRWADDPAAIAAMQRKVPESVTACYEQVERAIAGGPWVFSETYSISDPYLFTLAQWLEDDGVDMALLPKVAAHRDRVANRPAVQRALAAENE